MSEVFPQFAGTYQQDAHEVLTSIFDSFHLALNKTVNESGLLIVASSFDQNLLVRKTLSCLADASHRTVNDSFIDDTFFGQLSSIFSCYKCHKKLNETYEPFSTLALTIPIEKNNNNQENKYQNLKCAFDIISSFKELIVYLDKQNKLPNIASKVEKIIKNNINNEIPELTDLKNFFFKCNDTPDYIRT